MSLGPAEIVAPDIAVCVPARNEAQRLPRLFAALERLDTVRDRRLHVCVMLDGCTDASASVAQAYRQRSRHRVHIDAAPPSASNAGKARHRAMRLGTEALGAAGGVLLTTDADSWPRQDWLRATTAALGQADLVAGDVVRSGQAQPDQDRIDRYYARLFAYRRRLDPVAWEAAATHHHLSGANMAIRATHYAALGGFAPLASGEDARLADDAARAGLRVRRDAASVVHTSDRRCGRAEGGLATALRALDRAGLDGVTVAHPGDQAWQYRMHAAARAAFDDRGFFTLAGVIGLDSAHLLGVARDCPNAEAFAMRVVPVPPGGMRSVGFAVAEAMLATLCAAAAAARAA